MTDETIANDTDAQGHERRVAGILDKAKREVGVRDLVTFSVARIWTVLLAIASVIYAIVGHRRDGT